MVAAGLLILSSLLSLALGRPSAVHSEFVVRDQRSEVPLGFKPGNIRNFIPPGMLRLTIALPQNNATGLQASLLDVSDPTSENYGHHLSKSEVEQLVAPKAESSKAVSDWLSKNGISPDSTSASGDMVTIKVPAEKANALLNANFTTYTHEASNTTMVRTLAYSLPSDLQEHVAFIYPTTQFIPPASRKAAVKVIQPFRKTKRSQSKRADIPSQCAQVITPQCLQAIYNIPPTPATAAGNSLGVSGFGGEVANHDDLKDFLAQARPDITNSTFAVQSVDGGSDDGQGTTEASLDIQYTVGLATNVPTTFVSVGDQNQDGDLGGFLDIINFLLAQDDPPRVLTTSFGFDEAPFASQAPDLATTLCNAYAQLGARGTSVLFASGDGGVSGPQANDACDGQAFSPTFPSGCPFLTSVGSTQGINPETAAAFTSGGFSNIFAQPDYQADAVAGYLKTLGNTNAGLFNPKGRAFPDVSTQGVQFAIEVAGQLQGVDGTSASSPTFASVVALLNDALLNAGKSPLGFLNPMLYSQGAAALNDITSGSNPGCGTDGFPAVAGWDAVTGLGTPDFAKLLTLVTGSAASGNSSDASGQDAGTGNSTSTATDSAAASATDSAAATATESAAATATDSAAATATDSAAATATDSAAATATASSGSKKQQQKGGKADKQGKAAQNSKQAAQSSKQAAKQDGQA
ncbi:subtilisin-like protein [Polyporus arcularius HHB13444]|uniref:tripeptidyl-peptidase II n=1 Tax=Polyporus arcularius HHB13444 TaxID=1314778 RepID=A0A5C3PFY4_9APHY|nr:subtilisin-like protein [Polyporus arcularius HHB13444]